MVFPVWRKLRRQRGPSTYNRRGELRSRARWSATGVERDRIGRPRAELWDRVGRSGRQQRAGGWLTPWGSLAKTDLTFRCHLALGTELRSFPKIMPQHAQWVLLRSSPTRFAGRPAHIAICDCSTASFFFDRKRV